MAEYYHVSPSENKENILDEGLSPHMESNDWGGAHREWEERMEDAEAGHIEPEEVGPEPELSPMRRVHFATGIDDARKWAEQVDITRGEHNYGPISIFKVDTKGLPLIQKTADIGLKDTYTPKHVDPSRITHVEDIRP
jgi:hypothetical protein